MTARHHSVSDRQVRALAQGTSTPADLAPLLSGQVSKCLSMLALVVRAAEDDRHPEAEAAAAGWRLLTEVQRKAPDAVAEVLRYPSVGAWASHLTAGDQPEMPAGRLVLIAVAAAIRGGVPGAVVLPDSALDGESIHLPSLGTAMLPRDIRHPACVLRHHCNGTEVAGPRGRLALPRRLDADGPGWRALTSVPGSRLVIDDAYPYQFPAGIRLTGRLSPPSRGAWRRRTAGGLRVLSRDHRRTADEIASVIRAVVPLATPEGGMRSVTSRHAFGSIALSLPGDDVLMALTLAHEVQHAKLAALMDLVPLVKEAAANRYYAPWRPGPRPLAALLQGMYAHLEVARFWRRRRVAVPDAAEAWHANVEFAKWRNSCSLVADSMPGNQELTSCGAAFVDGMIEVLRTWRHDRIPALAVAQAEREIGEHKKKWDTQNRGS